MQSYCAVKRNANRVYKLYTFSSSIQDERFAWRSHPFTRASQSFPLFICHVGNRRLLASYVLRTLASLWFSQAFHCFSLAFFQKSLPFHWKLLWFSLQMVGIFTKSQGTFVKSQGIFIHNSPLFSEKASSDIDADLIGWGDVCDRGWQKNRRIFHYRMAWITMR